MKKIISLFQRNYDGDCLVRDEVMPGAEWVIAGEGVSYPQIRWHLLPVVENRKLWKRYEARQGRQSPATNFVPATDIDPVTGKQQGWLPRGKIGRKTNTSWPEAWTRPEARSLEDGTYELIGPKVQGNPEKVRPPPSRSPRCCTSERWGSNEPTKASRLSWSRDSWRALSGITPMAAW